MKRKLLCMLLTLALLLGLALGAAAREPGSWIQASEDYIDEKPLRKLNDLAREIGERHGVNVCLFISDTCDGMDHFDYAREEYDRNFPGTDGIAFIHWVEGKKVAVEAYGRLRDLVDQESLNAMMDAYLEPDYYDEGVEAYLEEADRTLTRVLPQPLEPTVPAQTLPGELLPAEMVTIPREIPDHRLLDRFVDNGGLVTQEEARRLNEKLDSLSTALEFDIVVVTVPGLNGMDPTPAADDFFDYNGYGWGEDADGVLLLVSVPDGAYGLSTHGFGLEAFIFGGREKLEGCFIPQLKQQEYAESFAGFADAAADFVEQARRGKPYGYVSPYHNWGYMLLISAVLGFLMGAVVTKKKKDKLTTVAAQAGAGSYYAEGTLAITRRQDNFVRSYETTQYIPKHTAHRSGSRSSDSNSSGSHTSSSGRTHGGWSGKF